MQNTKERIEENLYNIVKDFDIPIDKILVEETSDLIHGNLTSNIAMRIAKDLKSNPMDIANRVVDKYPKDEDIEKIEVANPGFINFFFSDKYLKEIVKDINQREDVFESDYLKDKKYIIEYTDPNPFKILHIGHLYTNIIGESFARLQESLGANISRANYQGDVGLHVAKTMYGLKVLFEKEGIHFSDLKNMDLAKRVEYLGEAYMLGFNLYDDQKDPEAIEQVDNINYYIFSFYISSLQPKEFFKEFEQLDIKTWYMEGKEWCMEYFERIYKRTGTKFDHYLLESEMSEKGLNLVLENTDGRGKNIFVSDDRAIIYRGDESKGLHTRVFVNKNGLPTYEAKDLALAFRKFELADFDQSVVITADEQKSYFEVVLDALSHLDSRIASKSKHFSHGMVKLPGAEKMASRKGKIIGGEWLLDETKKMVTNLIGEEKKFNSDQIEEISNAISIAAIKYAFLKVSIGKDVIFDFEKSISFDGDTGTYLLYVYARCKSLLEENKIQSLDSGEIVLDAYTKDLVGQISKYQSVLLSSAQSYSPNILCSYLFDLGQCFNTFYQNVRVLDSKDRDFLLTIVNATAKTMKHGLNVLGIQVIDRM